MKLFTALAQPLKLEVNAIFETSCVAAFDEINDAISPIPDAAKPVLTLLFIQLKVAPEGELEKVIIGTLAPEQTTGFSGEMVITGVGLTVIVIVCGAPEQPFMTGVTVSVDTCGVETVGAVKAEILPVPDAVKPVFRLLFVQLNVAPAGKPVKLIAAKLPPEHTA